MPDMTDDDILDSFRFIRFVNRWGGGHRAVRTALNIAMSSWPRERRAEILDVGCGIGDMAPTIFRWARDNGFSVRYNGIDKNTRIVELAQARKKIEGIRYSQGDLFDKDLAQSDIIIASMVFHHFNRGEIEKAVLHLLDKSRHALIINDLTRSPAVFLLCYLLTRFIKNKHSRNDALLSIRKGFRLEEMTELLDKLNIKGRVKKQFCGRLLIIIFKG
ncbi:MAG: methyltransferase domain-containing protein [Candidatus Omnitrophica bacterium]|nr:methyltransferase domain-containing protein [Candidatus Omnitrophota bacterium]